MLVVGSALKGYVIEAKDGGIGAVSDFLFDDRTWKVRWIVVDTGGWLNSRQVLVHPSAIALADYEHQELRTALTRAQIKGSPPIATDKPVSRRLEASLYGYYNSDYMWGGGYFGTGGLMSPLKLPLRTGDTPAGELPGVEAGSNDGDPHLRSITAILGYHMHATDGVLGHLENLLVEDSNWEIRYFIVDTRNWWPGEHVLLSPYAVREINWPEREFWLDVSREKVKASPPWKPLDMIDQVYEKRIHRHYGWAGYGW